ncbi:GNAT family N-acetyltransferase [Chitinimonas lacunae]|uniref:GNAT family N-acetyltransferase n=1 Tax=Chitinimonas lacunae TaxID=1963018 RepID=A0ABV8MSI3_9NEIS
MHWHWTRLEQLSALQWHEIGLLRQSVFVVEQRCPYPDLDRLDPVSDHLLGHDEHGRLVAYLRLVPPGLKFDQPSLGRVVVAPTARRSRLGQALVAEGLAGHVARYPGRPNLIGAQAYLTSFYESLGFITVSDTYLEDEIPHLDMRWDPPAAVANS